MSIDLDAYFSRIGYSGPRTASLDVLREVHARHPAAIAFENLDPLLGLGVKLDLPSLETKLVHGRRGGYCYEHNLLLADVLEQLGFRVTRLAARVLWNQPDDAMTTRSHMLLAVDLERRYIVDVGFGGQVMTAPLALETDVEQTTPHESFRIVAAGSYFRVQTQIERTWSTLYRFDLDPQFVGDYEVSSYYLSTNPTSHFVTGLIAARAMPGKRFALRNTRFAIHTKGAPSEVRMLTTVAEVRSVLDDGFGISVPDVAHANDTLARIVAPA